MANQSLDVINLVQDYYFPISLWTVAVVPVEGVSLVNLVSPPSPPSFFRRLEQQILIRRCSSSEEKKFRHEIDTLKKSKEQLM